MAIFKDDQNKSVVIERGLYVCFKQGVEQGGKVIDVRPSSFTVEVTNGDHGPFEVVLSNRQFWVE